MKFPSTVSDIMNDVISIEGSSLIEAAAKKMIDSRIGSIIVTKDGKPKGIITRSDMLSRVIVAYKDPRIHITETVMSSPLISIPKGTSILEAMRVMRDKNVTHLLIEENGDYVGIISEGDMVSAVTLSSMTQFSSLLRR